MDKGFFSKISVSFFVLLLIFFISARIAEASVIVDLISEVVDVLVDIIVVAALVAVVVVGGALVAGAIAKGLLILAPAIATTLAGTIIVAGVWLASSLWLADCAFDGSSVDPNWICTDKGGSGGAAALTVDVKVRPSGGSLSDGPASLSAPAAYDIFWAVSGVSSQDNCTASGAWSGTLEATAGQAGYSSVSAGDYNYELTCDQSGTIVSDSVMVNVIGPRVDLTVPPVVEIPDPLVLNWISSNVSSCSATSSPDVWNGNKNLNGSETIFGSTQFVNRGQYDFTLLCSDASGLLGGDRATTSVIQVPRCNFSASPLNVNPFQTSDLAWNCSYSNSCQITNNQSSIVYNLPISGGETSGSRTVRLATTTTAYTLSCSGLDGSRSWDQTINVGSSTGRIIEGNP